MSRISSRHGFTYFAYGRYALLIQWGSELSEEHIFQSISRLRSGIEEQYWPELIDIIAGYDSLTLTFRPELVTPEQLISHIEDMDLSNAQSEHTSTQHIIPVSYGTGPISDLEDVAVRTDLSVSDVIALHSSQIYQVRFLGFLPGFPYLTGLPEQLHLPRRAHPRPRIHAGSVAIATDQTGIYPSDSPGGWHIVGRTEFVLFDQDSSPPTPLKAGDTIKFEPI